MKQDALTIAQVREILRASPSSSLIEELRQDPRSGVQKLLESFDRRLVREGKEDERLKALAVIERDMRAMGYHRVGGIDEAGRGPLAGPVVAACVILPDSFSSLRGLNDSKLLSKDARSHLYDEIRELAVGFGIGVVPPDVIDEINIFQATRKAMLEAWESCEPRPDFLLIDGSGVPDLPAPQKAFPKADQRSACVAAASILAKVHRDRIMEMYDEHFPEYGFARHKGYGTAEHMVALARVGICSIHRKTFAPVNQYVLPSLETLRRSIERARGLDSLAAVGDRVRNALQFLTAEEIEELRSRYRDRKAELEEQERGGWQNRHGWSDG